MGKKFDGVDPVFFSNIVTMAIDNIRYITEVNSQQYTK
jgi:hypothetical protein